MIRSSRSTSLRGGIRRSSGPSGGPSRRSALLGGAALAASAAGGVVAQAPAERPLVVGGKNFTEQFVLAEIARQLLAREGFAVEARTGFATDEIRQAQLIGDVDITWDYTWTGYAFHHGFDEPLPADEVLDVLREVDVDNGLIWLNRSTVNNTYAFAVNLDFAAEACIHSMPDLAQALRNGMRLRFASESECPRRLDCLISAQSVYGFEFPADAITVVEAGQPVELLRERRAEVGVVFTTDGTIPAYDLELLADPEVVFAEYYITPVIREEIAVAQPAVRDLIERLTAALDTATQQELHYRVDIVGQSVEDVARFFLSTRAI